MLEYFSRDAFINKIKQLKEGGLPSKEIATRIGVHFTTIDRWVRGEVNLETLRIREYRAVMGDPQGSGHLKLAVQEDRPPYGLRPETAEVLGPFVRMLASIQEREPDRWSGLATIIESVYRDLRGGKRGARLKTGE